MTLDEILSNLAKMTTDEIRTELHRWMIGRHVAALGALCEEESPPVSPVPPRRKVWHVRDLAYQREWEQRVEGWWDEKYAELRDRIDALERASAQRGEAPTLEECISRFDEACERELKDPRVSRRKADHEGIAAVRSVCLSARAARVDVRRLWRDINDFGPGAEPVGDQVAVLTKALESQGVPVEEAEHA
jgi:hypothetical protein